MKYAALLSTSFTVALAIASPLSYPSSRELEQLSLFDDTQFHAGFDLDLNEVRLVQFEGQAPQFMTELEKVRIVDPYVCSCP